MTPAKQLPVDLLAMKMEARYLEEGGNLHDALTLYRDIIRQLEPKPLSRKTLDFYLKAGELARRIGDNDLASSTLISGADRFAKEGDATSVGELCLHILRADPQHKDVYAQYARRMLDYGHPESARRLLLDYAKRARSENLGKVLGQMQWWPEKDLQRLLTDFLDRIVPEERRRRRSSDHRRRPSEAIREADQISEPEAPSPPPPPPLPPSGDTAEAAVPTAPVDALPADTVLVEDAPDAPAETTEVPDTSPIASEPEPPDTAEVEPDATPAKREPETPSELDLEPHAVVLDEDAGVPPAIVVEPAAASPSEEGEAEGEALAPAETTEVPDTPPIASEPEPPDTPDVEPDATPAKREPEPPDTAEIEPDAAPPKGEPETPSELDVESRTVVLDEDAGVPPAIVVEPAAASHFEEEEAVAAVEVPTQEIEDRVDDESAPTEPEDPSQLEPVPAPAASDVFDPDPPGAPPEAPIDVPQHGAAPDSEADMLPVPTPEAVADVAVAASTDTPEPRRTRPWVWIPVSLAAAAGALWLAGTRSNPTDASAPAEPERVEQIAIASDAPTGDSARPPEAAAAGADRPPLSVTGGATTPPAAANDSATIRTAAEDEDPAPVTEPAPTPEPSPAPPETPADDPTAVAAQADSARDAMPTVAAAPVPRDTTPAAPTLGDTAAPVAEPEAPPVSVFPEGVTVEGTTVVVEGMPVLDATAFDAPAGRGYRILQLVGTADTLSLTVMPLDPNTPGQVGAGRVRVRETDGSSIGTTRFEHYLVTGKAALPAREIEVLLRQLIEVSPN